MYENFTLLLLLHVIILQGKKRKKKKKDNKCKTPSIHEGRKKEDPEWVTLSIKY